MQENYYLLGQAIGIFDPHGKQLTGPCISNLLRLPSRAAVILRHVWPDLLAHDACRNLLGRIDFPCFRPSALHHADFWLGFYHAKPTLAE